MSNTMLEETFNERFREYEYLWQVGEYYGAAKRLAEISHCLPALKDRARNEWSERIQSITSSIPNEIVIALEDSIGADAERISRILSVGTHWESEEILLVLGLRIEIDLMLSFLAERCSHNVTIPLPLDYIDGQLRELANSHKGGYEWALGMMEKNWGLPIRSEWLRLPAI